MNRDVAIIVFKANGIKKVEADLEVPLDISANDLFVAVNTAYNLGADTSDVKNCYLTAENPIALLRGNKTLAEYGIRNGSRIFFNREGK